MPLNIPCPHGPHLLDHPVTLPCGHSVCNSHLPSPCPRCPTTTPPPSTGPSFVRSQTPDPQPDPARTDIVLTEVLALVNATRESLHYLNPLPDHHVRPDDDDDEEHSRPRKRRRRSRDLDEEPDLVTSLRSASAVQKTVAADQPLPQSHPDRESILADFKKQLHEELTCRICHDLFYQPVTRFCQHTFCDRCLQRQLDYRLACPLCQQTLTAPMDHPINATIVHIIQQYFSEEYEERKKTILEEERNARLRTPILVLALSFPNMSVNLHFFEPRYRLMLRRCLDSPHPQFGMIPNNPPGTPPSEYGVMLRITKVETLRDGRSLLQTHCIYRFRILERGTHDGYMVARIEPIFDYVEEVGEGTQSSPVVPIASTSRVSGSDALDDHDEEDEDPNDPAPQNPVTGPAPIPHSGPTTEELIAICTRFLDRCRRGLAPWIIRRAQDTYGPMPNDTAAFTFWVACLLPIAESDRAKLLPIRSPRLRLVLIAHWIQSLENNWYAWLSFVVLDGWLVNGPAVPCLLWVAFVLTVFRLIGWI